MWSRKQKIAVDETQIAAQQQEVWLLQSQMAEKLLCGLLDEDLFEVQDMLASIKQMQLEEDRLELSARAQTHLHLKSAHRSGVIPLQPQQHGAQRPASKNSKKLKQTSKQGSAIVPAPNEEDEREKRIRQLHALRKLQL